MTTLALNLGGQVPHLNVQSITAGTQCVAPLRWQVLSCLTRGLLGDEQPWRDTATEVHLTPEPADSMLKPHSMVADTT